MGWRAKTREDARTAGARRAALAFMHQRHVVAHIPHQAMRYEKLSASSRCTARRYEKVSTALSAPLGSSLLASLFALHWRYSSGLELSTLRESRKAAFLESRVQ